jgi:hypothetical protein
MAGHGRQPRRDYLTIFSSFSCSPALPAFYLDGIHQPEPALKMPLLAVCVAFQVISSAVHQKTARLEVFAFIRSRKVVLFFLFTAYLDGNFGEQIH